MSTQSTASVVSDCSYRSKRLQQLQDEVLAKDPKAWNRFKLVQVLYLHEQCTGQSVEELTAIQIRSVLDERYQDASFCAVAMTNGLKHLAKRGFQAHDLGTYNIPVLQYLADIGCFSSPTA